MVDETDILGREGVMGWTGKSRAWYQANTVMQLDYIYVPQHASESEANPCSQICEEIG